MSNKSRSSDSTDGYVRQGNPGFTLIELLVVVAIIAILASLLLPSLARAKHTSKASNCTSNLRQIGLGISLYTSDQDGRFPIYDPANKPSPATLFWNNKSKLLGQHHDYNDPQGSNESTRILTPYIGKLIAECPLDEGYRPGAGENLESWGKFYRAYGNSYVYQAMILNRAGRNLETGHPATPVLWKARFADIQYPSLLAMVGDFTIQYAEYVTYGSNHYQFMQMHDPLKQDLNILFVDGHVDSTTMRNRPYHLINGDYNLIRPNIR